MSAPTSTEPTISESPFTRSDSKAEEPNPDVSRTQDSNGITVGAWSSDVSERNMRSAYFWMVCCCPCVAVAQLEVRLGRSGYAVALLKAAAHYIILYALFIAKIVLFASNGVLEWILIVAAFIIVSIITARRLARIRSVVRERFQIPGSDKDDRNVAFHKPLSSVRQMARHLQCDQAMLCGAPATLQAYEV